MGLVVKTNMAKNCQIDREIVHGRLLSIVKDPQYDNKKCRIYLLHGDLTDKEMHEIYLHPKIKSLVSFTHGEGFGLPIYEAAYTGELSAKNKMRQCYEDVTNGIDNSCEYAKELKERFSNEKMYAAFVDAMNIPTINVESPLSGEIVEFE